MSDYQFYDTVAETRWGKYLTGVEKDVILGAQQLCGTPTVALDIGAAGGRWSELLAEQGWEIICTDINPSSLERCRERVPRATCIRAEPDDTTLPCTPESIGLLLCVEVFQVIPTAWFISEASRTVKPNGLIVGVFNNKLSWRGYIHHLLSVACNRFDYYGTSYHRWRRELRRAGFQMLREEGLCWFPFSRTSNSPLVSLCTTVESRIGLRHLAVVSPWIVFAAQKDSKGMPYPPGEDGGGTQAKLPRSQVLVRE
jgi:SAM-dependent methyltransferase